MLKIKLKYIEQNRPTVWTGVDGVALACRYETMRHFLHGEIFTHFRLTDKQSLVTTNSYIIIETEFTVIKM